MTAILNKLNRWINDGSWTLDTEFSQKRFNECVLEVLLDNPGFDVTAQEFEDYIIGQFPNYSDPSMLKTHAHAAAIRFGAIQEFIKVNSLKLS
ncbi:hypothetical protein [Enterobacter quasiroggenkampii]|uniref:hypothetical protein n=1 Tax=Enterobacter quasiroggenkampii TaxID=2497436 RepID=UPI002075B956|nr:hypothetical protein [Enterobacter quasiroggenkampii]MCM7167807.1 hypothetical protein [Enterobacter quasiroggenkampii]